MVGGKNGPMNRKRHSVSKKRKPLDRAAACMVGRKWSGAKVVKRKVVIVGL